MAKYKGYFSGFAHIGADSAEAADKFAHLRELVQAERDGRLVVLPCKVGRLVWSMNNNGGVCSHQIRRFERNKDGDFACSALMFPLDDFGKTVFLTREEAEAALEA